LSTYVIMTSLESNPELDKIIKNYVPPKGMDLIGVISIINTFKGGSPKNLGKLDEELDQYERTAIYNSVFSSFFSDNPQVIPFQLSTLAMNIVDRLSNDFNPHQFTFTIHCRDSGSYVMINRYHQHLSDIIRTPMFHFSFHPSRGGRLDGDYSALNEVVTSNTRTGAFHITHQGRDRLSVPQGRTVFFSLELNSEEIKGETRFFLQVIGLPAGRGTNTLAIRYTPSITEVVNNMLRTIEIETRFIPKKFKKFEEVDTKQLKKHPDDKHDKGGPGYRRSERMIRRTQMAGKKKKRKTQKNKK